MLKEIDYASAIEVGCGAGHNFPLLDEAPRPIRLAGADLSREALQRAGAQRPDADLQALDIQLEAASGSWDVVLCSLVLEHLPDDLAALRNMRKMTKRHLIVATIAGDFERYRSWEQQMGHVRNYRRGELEQKLEACGFEVERVIYWGFPFYSPLARLLQNRMTSTAAYGTSTSLAARAMYWLYFLNTTRRGDVVLVRARVGDPGVS